MSGKFNYDLAFSRNIGWLTQAEQHSLKSKRVAIAGLGGVGGGHLLALVRLGISQFNLADFDHFECENTNRQVGATTRTYGRKKLDVLVEMATAINPEIDISVFSDGVNNDNITSFMKDVDCYVDALDFFELDIRRHIFAYSHENNIAAFTSAPIGLGTAYLNFLPGKMSFEEYFRLEGYTEAEQYLRFFLGLTPRALQSAYLVDAKRLDLANKKGPSNIVGCQLATGVMVAQIVKLFLRRGKIVSAPRALHFDAYTNQYKITWRPYGNNNILQKFAYKLAKRRLNT